MSKQSGILPCTPAAVCVTASGHASAWLSAVATTLPTERLSFWLPQVVLLPISDGLVLTSFAPLLVALLSPLLLREVPSR
jgi:hypothetical protein